MKFPSVPNIVRTLYTAANITQRISPLSRVQTALQPASNFAAGNIPTLRSMPIPFLGSLFSSSAKQQEAMSYPVQKSKDEWQAILSPEQFKVIREKGTEAPFTGKYDKFYPEKDSKQTFNCAACEAPLYTATHKFKSGCGWPAFFDAIPGAVTRFEDRTFGMTRTEIVCANCGGHLGHVFKGEGYGTPTDERHCVNSVSINFGEGKPAAKV